MVGQIFVLAVVVTATGFIWVRISRLTRARAGSRSNSCPHRRGATCATDPCRNPLEFLLALIARVALPYNVDSRKESDGHYSSVSYFKSRSEGFNCSKEAQMQKLIGKMARMYPLFILMGFMIVVTAFVVGYLNSQAAAAYFAESKAVRETTLMAQRATIESVGLWLPYFKFLGIGFMNLLARIPHSMLWG